jgi:putative transposase
VRVQALGPEAPVECLDERVVRGLTRPREVERDTLRIRPQIEVAADELRALIDADRLRIANPAADPFERRYDLAPLGLSSLKLALAQIEDQRMKRTRFSEEQIISILKEHEAGIAVAELCRKHGVSDASIYKWKAKYGGMDVSEAKRLKSLEDENTRLKRLLADAMLDNAALKDLLGKKW